MKWTTPIAAFLTFSFSAFGEAGLRELFQPPLTNEVIVDDGGYANGNYVNGHEYGLSTAGCPSCGPTSLGPGFGRWGHHGCKSHCCLGIWDGYCAEKRHFCPPPLPSVRPHFGCGHGIGAGGVLPRGLGRTAGDDCSAECHAPAPCHSGCLPHLRMRGFAHLHGFWHRLRDRGAACDACDVGCDAGDQCASGVPEALHGEPSMEGMDLREFMQQPTSVEEPSRGVEDKSARRRMFLLETLFPKSM